MIIRIAHEDFPAMKQLPRASSKEVRVSFKNYDLVFDSQEDAEMLAKEILGSGCSVDALPPCVGSIVHCKHRTAQTPCKVLGILPKDSYGMSSGVAILVLGFRGITFLARAEDWEERK